MNQPTPRAPDPLDQTMTNISPDQYRAMVKDAVPHTLIDVREPAEWKAGHIDNSVPMSSGIVAFKINEVVPDKSSMVALYCATGGRSSACAQLLAQMGYTNVKNLAGGYTAYLESER